jgi:hypothetical protein
MRDDDEMRAPNEPFERRRRPHARRRHVASRQHGGDQRRHCISVGRVTPSPRRERAARRGGAMSSRSLFRRAAFSADGARCFGGGCLYII